MNTRASSFLRLLLKSLCLVIFLSLFTATVYALPLKGTIVANFSPDPTTDADLFLDGNPMTLGMPSSGGGSAGGNELFLTFNPSYGSTIIVDGV